MAGRSRLISVAIPPGRRVLLVNSSGATRFAAAAPPASASGKFCPEATNTAPCAVVNDLLDTAAEVPYRSAPEIRTVPVELNGAGCAPATPTETPTNGTTAATALSA